MEPGPYELAGHLVTISQLLDCPLKGNNSLEWHL